MKKIHYYLMITFLLFSNLTYAQFEIEGLKKYNITFMLPNDWINKQEIVNQEYNNIYFLRIQKKMDTHERKYLNIVIRIDISNKEFLESKMSDKGVVKIDSIDISGHKVKRLFGENIGVIDELNTGKIFDYSIYWSIRLGNDKFLSIMGSYYADNENEREQLKIELISIVGLIKIE